MGAKKTADDPQGAVAASMNSLLEVDAVCNISAKRAGHSVFKGRGAWYSMGVPHMNVSLAN